MPNAERRHCVRCKRELPAQAGPGRPPKLCTGCRTPGADKHGRIKPLPVERARTLQLADPEPVIQVGDDLVIQLANPHGLDAAGLALYAEYEDQPLSPLHRRLLVEASRLADRMEKFHRLLRGDSRQWAAMRIDEDIREVAPDVPEIHVKIIVTSVVQEARHTASALKAIITEIRTALRMATADEGDSAGGDALEQLLSRPDDLSERRANRAGA